MATIRSFCALRPAKGYEQQIAAPPYDTLSSEEARQRAGEYSFLHVTKSEIDLPPETNAYDDGIYAKARENLDAMVAKGLLAADGKPCLYIYRLTWRGKSQTGLVACVSVDEYLSGVIKKHELTLDTKEQDRIRHIKATDANTGPVFLAYRSSDAVKAIINDWTHKNPPTCDFEADDDVRHAVWVIDDASVIDALTSRFAGIPNLYIADGHHRSASTAKVCLAHRESDGGGKPEAEYNYYLSVIFPDDELYIMDYNRLIKDLNGYTGPGFVNELGRKWKVERTDLTGAKPGEKYSFGMYLDGAWHKVTPAGSLLTDGMTPTEKLDVVVLQNEILTPLLGIGDLRTDKRISFVGGKRGLGELQKRVDSGEMAVAFAVYPTSMSELFAIADAGDIMPPKSTWFEPKLRSGLFVHRLG